MKKKLEAELISIAHRILQLKDKSDIQQLQEETRQLYEKLTILNFSESHFSGPQPTIGQVRAALEKDESDKPEESNELKEVRKKIHEIITLKPSFEIEEKLKTETPIEPIIDHKEKKDEIPNIEDKPELVIEEINARVTEDLFVPASTGTEDPAAVSDIQAKTSSEKSNIGFASQEMPVFDNLDHDDKPKSLNDQLRKDIHIGLNDRLAFIKYLFDGSAPDYNRVLSQLNTFRHKNEAQDFINNMIRPDYNNWEGKEEYEERFMDIVLNKFEQ